MNFKAVTLFLAMLPLLAQAPDDGRAWLNKGVQAYKNARYQDAVEAFQKATDLNPNEVAPHLYLATTFMQLYIPGADFPENVEIGRRVEAEFLLVLRLDPNNLTAMQSVASLYYQQALGLTDQKFRKLDESASWYAKVLAVDPRNKEAYYSIGAIHWLKFYAEVMNAQADLGMRPVEPGPLRDPTLRRKLRDKYSSMIEDGISNLQKALAIDPDYADAMAYMNLLIRYRADLTDSPEQYRREIELADHWVQKAMETKKTRTGTLGSGFAVPPPPPPPPPPAPPKTRSSPSQSVQRIRVDGNVQSDNLISKVDPVYPPLARQARIQGTVRFTAIIAVDGKVSNLQLISGHPLMVESARQAVQQWLYRPTLLNGELVEVVTQIDVDFRLQ